MHRFSATACCLGLLAVASSCIIESRGVPNAETPHETYARSLSKAAVRDSALARRWLRAADSVLRDPLDIDAPFRAAGEFTRLEARAVGFRLTVQTGQVATVVLRVEGAPMQVFAELFTPSVDGAPPFTHGGSAQVDSTVESRSVGAGPTLRRYTLTLTSEARERTQMIVRIQPELFRDGRYRVELTTGPILAFPVAGGRNESVQSFFGAERDGGRRKHHGIDIFAPRGTPVLSVVDGVVRSLAPNRLGGNVVWLFDPDRALWLYYAHLDRQATREGQVVRIGDTLGFVGNTGNAKTTPPHLHFAIYRSNGEATDPWPWVRRVGIQSRSAIASRSIARCKSPDMRSGLC